MPGGGACATSWRGLVRESCVDLLAYPEDARHPHHVADWQGALLMHRIDRHQLDRLGGTALELLYHHLAVLGLDHHAVALADRGRRRDDDHRAVGIGGLHRVPEYLERVGVFVGDRRKRDFVPAFAHRKAGVIEIAAGAGLREADQRYRLADRAGSVVDQLDEGLDASAGRGQRFRHRLSRRPTRAALRGDPLRLVEGGRIEAGLFGKSGRRQAGAGGEPVKGGPDLEMGQHRTIPRHVREKTAEFGLYIGIMARFERWPQLRMALPTRLQQRKEKLVASRCCGYFPVYCWGSQTTGNLGSFRVDEA